MAVAAWDRADPLFRFVEVRAPQVMRPPPDTRLPRVRTYFEDAPTKLHEALRTASKADRPNDMIDEAGRFITEQRRDSWNGAEFCGTRASIDDWLWEFDDYLIGAGDHLEMAALDKELAQILRTVTASEAHEDLNYVALRKFRDLLKSLWRDVGDSMMAVSIWPLASAESQALLARVIRLIGLLNEILAAGWTLPGTDNRGTLDSFLGAKRVQMNLVDGLVLLPADTFPIPPARVPPQAPMLMANSLRAASPSGTAAAPLRPLLARAIRTLSQVLHLSGDARDRPDHLPRIRDVASQLGDDTHAVLRSHSISNDLTVPEAIAVLDRRQQTAPGFPLSGPEPAVVAALRTLAAKEPRIPSGGYEGPLERFLDHDWNAGNLNRFPIVGDLHVVQQDLLRYR
jgi:hypothetical protein